MKKPRIETFAMGVMWVTFPIAVIADLFAVYGNYQRCDYALMILDCFLLLTVCFSFIGAYVMLKGLRAQRINEFDLRRREERCENYELVMNHSQKENEEWRNRYHALSEHNKNLRDQRKRAALENLDQTDKLHQEIKDLENTIERLKRGTKK